MSRIVVVDDQGTSRRVISMLASTVEDNVAVVEFADPLDALSFFRENTADLVIADYSMPVINGAEFVRRFRGMPKCYGVPVVVVTAFTNPEFRRLALEAGTNDYMSLPLDFEEFRLKSRNLLALRGSGQFPTSQLRSLTVDDVLAVEVEQNQPQVEVLDGLLQTISRRLIDKIRELDLAYGDLGALLDASPCAAVFVDKGLSIYRFTAAAAALLNLGHEDIGRHLSLTNGHLLRPDLLVDLALAKDRRRIVDKFVEHPKTGHFYRVRTVPVKYIDDALWGAIILFDRIQVAARGSA